ncbi:hypothetical protein T08_3925 [Trichinella sp. T8]|uniref:Uncharacterized protein n=1 Tax=Trichinella murrelli TaxID=144512 RepID=A0A0V0TDG2_9BILA|nr:hypothetical protein T05_2831 [Trichinella murrelli]KRZ93409.1 hypothetical protein T08_3925 [Trichinella sp. T8]
MAVITFRFEDLTILSSHHDQGSAEPRLRNAETIHKNIITVYKDVKCSSINQQGIVKTYKAF